MSAQTPEEQFVESEKWADIPPAVHELIRRRWSPRAFADREVSADDLRAMLEAARWAASSSNEQPWRFLVARKSDPEAFSKILALLVPGNQAWAKAAPVLIIMAAKKTIGKDDAPNHYAMHDAGQAFANLALQAVALGLHAHGMAGLDRARARTELGIPADFEVAAAIAVGYLGSPAELPPNYRERELNKRHRKPLNEIAFGAEWDQSLKL